MEAAELARWKAHDVFARSTAQRAGAEPWVFYEGPPTANGKPGLHHVWARVYKDLFCRYHTMRGRSVSRRAGWDTHGLPVEVQVEKQLGISGKRAIVEEVGVAEFTRLCKLSVLEHIDEFEKLTERIGYWLDLDDAYYTFTPSYVESVWWQLKQIFDKGLLYEDLKVVPYCPRCGTGLSSHELGQPGVYTDEEDESAYVRLPIVNLDHPGLHGATHLAVWTTTPWTLLSNVAVAVNPEVTYAV
ncbi:MAG: class I tRNA ligase family protein, partial [Acidobacteriota bacterium]|nr:class I tRNA ligase family protein [Acidobacteriota bacterium]